LSHAFLTFPESLKNPEGSILEVLNFVALKEKIKYHEKVQSKPTVQGLCKAKGVNLQESMLVLAAIERSK